jgi:DNA-directed RNA polymerase subunit RPC12/RpoP
MNIFKRYKEKQIEKRVNVYYECLYNGKSHDLRTVLFFNFEKDIREFNCPECGMKLTFKYGKSIIDQSNKRSKSMHFSTLIK